MSTHAPYDAIEAVVRVFTMAHQFIRQSVEGVPEARMTEQPGTLVNHPAWTLAHLNAYAALILTMLDDRSVPDADAELARFGYGSTPITDPAAYSTKAELLSRFNERHARVAAVVAERHGEYFPRPSPKQFQPHSSNIGHVVIILMTTHLGHHLGQLNQWRTAAGLSHR
ncbi:MAG: DinB family protein [Phycisphaerales bacterium]|nr:DinB family protein [Phycisphaerales bacterium]